MSGEDVFVMKSVRQREIINLLEKNGYVNTADAAAQFNVSVATIRRDLDQLERQGLLVKNYGGAEPQQNTPPTIASFQLRQNVFHDVKAAIAAQALKHIPDHCTIALDAGSTIFELCTLLSEKKDLIVICGDIHSAQEILKSGNNRAYMMGGFLTPYGTSSGDFAEEFVSRISNIDIFLCSTDGAHPKEGLSTNEIGINHLKKCFLNKASKTIALIDHSKFSQRAFYKMCEFSDIDLLITDTETPQDIIDSIRACGTEVEIAGC